MPFDDLLTPVAVPAEQQHDAATCRAERQEPDVGEGWADLRSKVYGLSAQGNAILADALQKAASEVERLKKSEAALLREVEIDAKQIATREAIIERLRSEVERLRLRPEEVRFLLGVKNFNGHLVNELLKRQGGGE